MKEFSYNSRRHVGSIAFIYNFLFKVSTGGKRKKDEIYVDSLDFNKKILHTAWHPSENVIAVAATNNLFLLQVINYLSISIQSVLSDKSLIGFIFIRKVPLHLKHKSILISGQILKDYVLNCQSKSSITQISIIITALIPHDKVQITKAYWNNTMFGCSCDIICHHEHSWNYYIVQLLFMSMSSTSRQLNWHIDHNIHSEYFEYFLLKVSVLEWNL